MPNYVKPYYTSAMPSNTLINRFDPAFHVSVVNLIMYYKINALTLV